MTIHRNGGGTGVNSCFSFSVNDYTFRNQRMSGVQVANQRVPNHSPLSTPKKNENYLD